MKKPEVMITDKCMTLKNILSSTLPSVPQILCLFHVSRVVEHQIKQTFNTADYFSESQEYENIKRQQDDALTA